MSPHHSIPAPHNRCLGENVARRLTIRWTAHVTCEETNSTQTWLWMNRRKQRTIQEPMDAEVFWPRTNTGRTARIGRVWVSVGTRREPVPRMRFAKRAGGVRLQIREYFRGGPGASTTSRNNRRMPQDTPAAQTKTTSDARRDRVGEELQKGDDLLLAGPVMAGKDIR